MLAVLPGAGGGLYPAGYADDVGPFLYLAPLGHFLHITNPYTLYRIEFVALWTIAIVIWPLVFSRLFRSRLAGFVAPILLIIYVVEDARVTNQYWVPGWAVAVCVPLLMLAVQRIRSGRRDAPTWLLVGFAVATAAFANTLRASSGYGILAAALGVAIAIVPGWRRRALAAVAVLGVFWLASSGVIDAATAYRNAVDGKQPLAQAFSHSLGGTTVDSIAGSAHPFWHTAYIGLGFDPNRYGIYYTDSNAYNYVLSVHPGAKADSPVEASTLEKRYFHLLISDPGFILGGYVHKAAISLNMAVQDSWLVLVLVPLALLSSARRRHLAVWLALFVPSLLVLLAVPTLVIPGNGYQFGFLNGVRVLMVVLLCWIAAELEFALLRRTAPGAPSRLDALLARYVTPYLPVGRFHGGSIGGSTSRARPTDLARGAAKVGRAISKGVPRRLALVTAMVVVLEVVGSVGASAVAASEAAALLRSNRPSEAAQILPHQQVLRWTPSASQLSGWSVANGAQLLATTGTAVATQPAVAIRTTTQRWAYQVVGPTLTLPGGSYQLFVNGSARDRGVTLLALDPDTNTTLAVSRYGPDVQGWGLKFSLPSQSTLRFVLANNGGSAFWTIRSIEFGRSYLSPQLDNINASSQPCGAYVPPAPGARPQLAESPPPPPIRTVLVWRAGKLHKTWPPLTGASTALTRHRLVVRTSAASYGYQLASPVVAPAAGKYELRVTGSLASGGLEILAEVPGNPTPIAQRSFGSGLPGSSLTMVLPFRVPESEAMQFVLANSTPSGDAATKWTISRIVLARTR